MLKKTGWFAFLLLLAISCLDEPDCFSLNNNVIGIAFKKMSDSKADTVVLISVTAEGTDSVFRANTILTGIDKLPLNYYQGETVFYFQDLDSARVLHLGYSAKSQLVSEECGERFVVTGLQVLNHAFDSIRIVSATPKRSDGGGTHLEIYRCPNTSQVKLRFSTPVVIEDVQPQGYEAPANLPTSEPVTTINIPLNTEADISTIEFKINGLIQILTLAYSREEETLFSACGSQMILSNFEVVSSSFSSASVVSHSISDPPHINLEITL